MENGDGRGSGGSYLEEAEVAAAGGDSVQEMANGDAHRSPEAKSVIEELGLGEVESKDSEDGEVFEEAIDDMQAQQKQWQSGTSGNEHVSCGQSGTSGNEHVSCGQSGTSGNEHVSCAVDNGDGGGVVDEENQEPGLVHDTEKFDKQCKKLDETKDAQVEGEPVFSDAKGGSWEASDGARGEDDGKEAELNQLMCVNEEEEVGAADSGLVIEECTSLPVNGGDAKLEIEVAKTPESVDFGTNGAPVDIQENGNSSEVTAHERDASESNGPLSCNKEIHQTQEAIVEKVASIDKETEGLSGGHVDSLQVIAEKDDAVQTDACKSSVEASEAVSQFLAESKEQKEKDGGGGAHLSSQVQEEFGQDGMIVEDSGEPSSSGEDENTTSVEPPPAATSSLKKSSGPSLPSQPAGLGSSAPLLEPASRSVQPTRTNGSTPLSQSQILDEPANGDAEENDETREKLQMIRVKFLRLAHRLGQTPHNVVVAQVLYRLGLAEQLRGSRNTNRAGAFSFDRASAMAEHLESSGQEPLDFSCTIMVIGKTGVGKSATINSIFDEVKFSTNAFQSGTKKVQDIVGTVQGIKVRVIDTPGLSPSSSDQRKNEKILHSVKSFIKKSPPDIVLYLDRLDMQSRDYGDVPLLRTITDIFGTSIWFNAIVVLTHAASAPPDGTNGTPLSYEMFVTQRSHVVQQAIRQAAADMRLMNPVSLVENHSACRMNRAGQRVLPNGQVWKPQLLLLSFASKILAEANELLKLQDSPPGKPFSARARVPPLPFLLSSLLQSRPQLKLPEEQIGDDDSMEEDLDNASDSGDESDYDELPPFKCLTRAQLAKLSKAQKKAYYEELDYREKLFYKKQLKEEKRRRRLLKKMASSAKEVSDDYTNENLEDESTVPASVPVPMADLVLPASFDSDYPSHRYRFLDSSSPWIVRPVLETQGWDHDVGYEGLNVERMFVVKDKIPITVSGQLTKDKKECTLQMEAASSIRHGEGKSTSLGLDMQSVGKDMAYTLRGETRFNNFRCNDTATGVSVTLLGDSLSAGVKIEDKLILNRRFRIIMNGGAMTGRGDVAYGGRLEAILRDKDYPLVRTFTTLALSVVDWHGDLALGCNLQSQLPIGRHTNLIGHANLNNRGTGQVGIRINSSEHLQIALVALMPVLKNIQRMFSGSLQST